jgi:RNA polymerase sigma-70 factor (ECF subfamily)
MSDSMSSTNAPKLFPATHWSVVLAARAGNDSDSLRALEALCRAYWYPLYAYLRRQGRSPHDAQDLTQGFFARLLEKHYLDAADQEKGRFRSFLLMALKRYLAKEWERERAQKRGGGQTALSLNTEMAERRYQGEGAEHLPPDRAYERRWALTLLDQALAALRQDYQALGREAEFECLKGYLTAERGEIPYAEVAERLGMTEGTARAAVHRMRSRFRALFRAEISRTVAGPEEVEDEVRHLRRALTS